VAISDPDTAHFTAHKNVGNTSIAYKPRYTHTHTHPETLEAREKTQVALWLVIDPCVNFGRVYCDFLVYIFYSSIF
jgi:hypothetical protein